MWPILHNIFANSRKNKPVHPENRGYNSVMPGYSNNFNDELRARLSIVDVVGRRVPLTKRGKDFWGCCPFHNEKTPSFKVNEEMGRFYCFGCGEKGDIISFTMKTQNMQYPDAIRELANMAGLKVPEYKPKDAATVEREQNYFDIMENAAKLYADRLDSPDGEFALSYIRGRGFSDADIKKYRIGFAPNGNTIAAKFGNVKLANLIATGLVRESKTPGGAPYDFFRNKLMFPIFNPAGQIVAFSGRSLDGTEPKYINSAETEFFKKRLTVFGLNFARNEIYKANRSIVVEGAIDAIKMQINGFGETVAPLGTALSEEHLQVLNKSNRNITFCFDGDKAGQKAAARAMSVAMPLLRPESDVRFAFVIGGSDPDDILKQKDGREQMKRIVDSAMSLERFLWDIACKNHLVSTPRGQAMAEKFFMGEVEKIQDFSLKSRFKQFFFDMRRENWKFTRRASILPVPEIGALEQKTLSEIAANFPETVEKHSEFLLKIGADLGHEGRESGTGISAADAERFIVSLKLKHYLEILQKEKKELTARMLDPLNLQGQADSTRMAELDGEIRKTTENIQKISEI
ncbi:MAG: DNA primase [Alphaproteobacteria bacterium]|nr:DNA primase [Alphaproteobacteria bacterium]MCL2757708.1 DNA primase [Alphaproteobacteria bacterium]